MSTEIQISKVLDSPDKRPRSEKVWTGIVIHHTGLPTQIPQDRSSWEKFNASIAAWLSKKDDAYLSAHYQIGRFGEITQIVDPDRFESFHAGKSEFWHPGKRAVVQDWNRHSIGIELLGDGNLAEYSSEQYHSLAMLCQSLMNRYPSISPQCIVGHEQIAPGRKSDPGKMFDWRRFFGLLFKG